MTGTAAGEDRGRFPLGAAVTTADLDGSPHRLLRTLREQEPVSWLPALGGWLVTSHDLASRVMRDSELFTVDDPRFSTARVVGPSMLSLDGAAHRRHRDPFTQAFRGAEASALESFAVATAGRLVAGIREDGRAELRRSLAGPLAVAVVAELLGLAETEPAVILSWYDAIVSAVTALSAEPSRGGPPAAASPAGDMPSAAFAAGAPPPPSRPPHSSPPYHRQHRERLPGRPWGVRCAAGQHRGSDRPPRRVLAARRGGRERRPEHG